jgi:pimeloyl-ACP methyl ester carboxylesterase
MKAWRFRFLVYLVIVLGVLSGMVEFLANFTTLVPIVSRPAFNPSELGLPFERVEITSADHLRLVAWYLPAKTLFPTNRPPVVVVHGLGAAKDFMLNYLMLASRLGHPVLAVDLRGHGESDRTITTLGWQESRDLTLWMNFLEARGLKKPVLWGHSLGATTCILAASEDSRVSGLIADAPFDSLRNTMTVHAKLFFGLPEYPLVPLTFWRVGRKLGIDPTQIDTVAAIQKIKCPVLVMVGENDQRMAPAMVRTIYDAAPQPKTFWIIPGGDHETRPFTPEYQTTVKTFLNALPPVASP